jgi:hypothetical protein
VGNKIDEILFTQYPGKCEQLNARKRLVFLLEVHLAGVVHAGDNKLAIKPE